MSSISVLSNENILNESQISEAIDQVYDLGIPDTDVTFESREELVKALKSWAIGRGFCLTIDKGSDKSKVHLKCDLGGKYRNYGRHGKRVNTSTRLIGCPYKLTGRISSLDGIWRIKISNATHSHEAYSKDQMISRSQARAHSLESSHDKIQNLITTIQPRKIASAMRREDPSVLLTAKDLSNFRAKQVQDMLRHRTPIQALIDDLALAEIPYMTKVDDENHLSHLFFAFPGAIKLMKLYHTVIVLDSTYKTNKFRMPLLHAVGLSATYQSFSAFYCFLKSETTEDYNWALSAAKKLFGGLKIEVIMTDNDLALMNAVRLHFSNAQNLLCNWHIWKNIMAKHRGSFQSKADWDEWEKAWKVVLTLYVERQWMPYKERFAHPWTSAYRHLGHTTSSRAESAHAKIKSYIEVSTGNLFSVFGRLKDSHDSEMSEISAQIGKERHKLGNRFRDPIFQKVNFKIAHKALRMVADFITQINKQAKVEIHSRDAQNDQCSNNLETIWGIPCRHKIGRYLQQDRKLEISDFCPQWHLHDPREVEIKCETEALLDRPLSEVMQELGDEIQTWSQHKQLAARMELERIRDIETYGSDTSSLISIQNPTTLRPKGRPSCAFNRSNAVGASGKRRLVTESSTRREPSAFERAAGAADDTLQSRKRARTTRVCSICKAQGHDRRNCSKVELVEIVENGEDHEDALTNVIDI